MPLEGAVLFELYRGDQFYWWRKPEYPEKTTDRPAANHWQTKCYVHFAVSGIRTHNFSDDSHGLHM